MGVTKTNLFTEEQNKLSNMAKALGHPARIAIIQYLIEENACVNGAFVKEIGLAQATISQHLRELKDAGLIKGTIQGKKMQYCINSQNWAEVEHAFRAFFLKHQTKGPIECC